MLKIGVTGGIGSGKSVVCRIFAILGVPVYNADDQARKIMRDDRQLHVKLKEAFGQGIIKDGKPDRKALAGIVFSDSLSLGRLNSIVHPAVLSDFRSWLERHSDASYIVKEAAIMFESGMYDQLDAVILVTAPESLRIQRVMNRDGESEENIRRRMASQWNDEKKEKLAGLVVRNDNINALLPVILQLHSEFSRGIISKEI